jgi:hypothetical protein
MEIDPIIPGMWHRSRILVVSPLVRMGELGLRVQVIRRRSLIRIWGGIDEALSGPNILSLRSFPLPMSSVNLLMFCFLSVEHSAVRDSLLCAWMSIVRI